MKKKNLLILILFFTNLLFPINSLTRIEQPDKELKPKNSKSRTTIIVSGKKRIYYQLSTKPASVLSTKGPGELTIYTRIPFARNQQKNLDYKVYYSVDGAPKKEKYFKNVYKSGEAVYENDSLNIPSANNKFVINLPNGEHTIKVWLGNENPKAAARFLFKSKKEKKTDWLPFSPLEPKVPVELISDEEIIKYYRFSKNKPLRVQVSGPTSLRILTRIENLCLTKGKVNYRLQVKENRKIKNTYQLCTSRSKTVYYKNDGSDIPGKVKEIVIDVPSGKHIYEIIPLDQDKSSVLGRILFPKKDINRGE